ncbi:hypothetical protein SAMN04488515_1137 [Cognatiyoonia koreensis]|uniref:Tellurium resistance protein n=1 Tax=Cognatiyoonia koreensis TaxID=364200 RepID=A0A1I0PC75_9RHOB|nr:TrgA family protein [Cognatiyoonia koreensis]SEW11736.1 hypothetical protein SAMN04488515_1137 [Cognatiyoonia koreensis]
MPTAGRLTAAIAFAVIGGYIATLISPLFEDGKQPSWWYPLCVLSGLWAGWVVVGKRAGRGYSSAVGNGITGVIAQCFWIIFLMSFADMIKKSLRKSYDGPVEAVVNVFEIMAEYGFAFWSPTLAGIIIGCGVAGGLFAEFFAKRFP